MLFALKEEFKVKSKPEGSLGEKELGIITK